MNKLGFLLGLSLLIGIVSCDDGVDECVRASLTLESETRDLKDYNGVVFNTVGNVFLTQGPEYAFKISGPDNVIALTTTTIENNLLIIGSDACFNGAYDLTVEITAPEFTYINLSGVGDVKSVGRIDGEIITMEMLGVGNINAQFYADSLITTIAGTGDIIYTGEVIKHELSCSGNFSLSADGLETSRTIINLTGIGDSYVKANEFLNVKITGTGNVYYKGTPVIQQEIIGTGSVINNN